MNYYVTNAKSGFEPGKADWVSAQEAEMKLIKIYPEIQEQTIIGFGGALTESSAFVYSKMGKESQKKLMELYFGNQGNRYNLGRLHIQSCDFSLGNRAYVIEGDEELKSFSIKDDFKFQIPFIKEALKYNAGIEFLASPWSPPAFMKTNGEMNHGGELREEYYQTWAKIMVRYVLAYKKEGIHISRLTVQNEPAAVQIWDSCIFSAKQEAVFASDYLRKALDAAGLLKVKILIWDHNKDKIIERCKESFQVEQAEEKIDGVAYHWYSGDHFEALDYIHRKYPDKEILFTEGCVEYSKFSDMDQISNAEMYAHNMIGDLNAGMNGFLDWNLILDHKGGPNHVHNFCDAPIMCNYEQDTIDIKLSYYYIGHFSRFIQTGSKRLLSSSFTNEIECVAFENPDHNKVAVILNRTDKEHQFMLWMQNQGTNLKLAAHSIMTVLLD